MLRISSFSIGLLLFSVLSGHAPGLESASPGLVAFLTLSTFGVIVLTCGLLPLAALCREVFRSTAARPVSRGGIVRW